jgi:hypothetical protein
MLSVPLKTTKPLKVGENFLLFLKCLPATGAYLAFEGLGSFKL